MTLSRQMRDRDQGMVPRALVIGMFALAGATLVLVAAEQLSGRPNTGVLVEAPVLDSRTVRIESLGGSYAIDDADGTRLAASTDPLGGFYDVIGRTLERRRMVHGIAGNPTIEVVRRTNGNIALLDPATDFTVELIGYGADNVAAFARLLD